MKYIYRQSPGYKQDRGVDSGACASSYGGAAYRIYATPPQLTGASAVFTKYLLHKLRRRSVNGAGVSVRNSNVKGGACFM